MKVAFRALSMPSCAAPSITFYKDVLPILQSRCQECHRDGEIGPMAVHDVQGDAALGEGDPRSGSAEEDAAMVRRSRSTGISRTTGR